MDLQGRARSDTSTAFSLLSSSIEVAVEKASSRERAAIPFTMLGGLVIIPHSVAMA